MSNAYSRVSTRIAHVMCAAAPFSCSSPFMVSAPARSGQLRLDDVDWEHDFLHVRRVKRRKVQTYPLAASVGAAIARYLREVRPPSKRRELFLGLNSPHEPVSQGAIHHIVATGLKRVGARTPRFGPHSLRHACAGRLVSEGFSLKEIGDHLGHRGVATTRIYAKVNLPALREVAAFDLGGLR